LKKGELNTSYQKRWCVLTGNLFFYFEKRWVFLFSKYAVTTQPDLVF